MQAKQTAILKTNTSRYSAFLIVLIITVSHLILQNVVSYLAKERVPKVRSHNVHLPLPQAQRGQMP